VGRPRRRARRQGAYLRYPIDDMLNLIALESRRAGAVIIGEDLGVVPPGLRATLADHGLLGMRVLPFERDEDGAFKPPADLGPARRGHDQHPRPVADAGWWRGRDIDWRERLDAPGDREAERESRAKDRIAFWEGATAAGLAEGPLPPADAPTKRWIRRWPLSARRPCELALVPIEDLLAWTNSPISRAS
jgi:4-alpha-glucanotransferase